MERSTVYLPEELKAALARTARDRGSSEADLIREGVRRVVEERVSPRPRIPLFASGQPGLAENIEEAMRGFGEA